MRPAMNKRNRIMVCDLAASIDGFRLSQEAGQRLEVGQSGVAQLGLAGVEALEPTQLTEPCKSGVGHLGGTPNNRPERVVFQPLKRPSHRRAVNPYALRSSLFRLANHGSSL
jgi:hypothetical protein